MAMACGSHYLMVLGDQYLRSRNMICLFKNSNNILSFLFLNSELVIFSRRLNNSVKYTNVHYQDILIGSGGGLFHKHGSYTDRRGKNI